MKFPMMRNFNEVEKGHWDSLPMYKLYSIIYFIDARSVNARHRHISFNDAVLCNDCFKISEMEYLGSRYRTATFRFKYYGA